MKGKWRRKERISIREIYFYFFKVFFFGKVRKRVDFLNDYLDNCVI